MDIEDLTIGQARKLVEMFPTQNNAADDTHWEIGKCYLIRTVTMIQTGRLVRVGKQELVLEDAAWIADTGRFADVLTSLAFNEVEPFPQGNVIVGRGAIVDAVQISNVVRVQK